MIHLERQNGVALLRMEHGKANAMDTDFFKKLTARLEEIERSDARAVVLTGTGKIFSAGVDLFRILEDGPSYTKVFLDSLDAGLMKVFAYPKPVIAAINGHAIAGGCVLACACDYKIMTDGSGTMGVPERVVGVPFPTLPLEIMRFAAPNQIMQELVYLGRTYGVREALQKGLIDEAADAEQLLNRAIKIAENFGRACSETFSLTKKLLRQPALDRYEREKSLIDPLVEKVWTSQEAHQAIRDYLNKVIGKGGKK